MDIIVTYSSSTTRMDNRRNSTYRNLKSDIMVSKDVIFEIKNRFEKALDAKTGWGKEQIKALYSDIVIEVLTEVL